MNPHHGGARRAFLRRCTHIAIAGSAWPLALNLAAMGDAAAMEASDYKALVCIFLQGGNDHANTVVPFDAASHQRYSAIRGSIAISQAALQATQLRPLVPLPGEASFALHPSMAAVASLFNAGKAAVLFNVGPLVVPLTRAQYATGDRRRYPVPPKLFSHNDQQSMWQSCAPEGATAGWGGRLGDLALAANQRSLFTCISVTGNAVMVSGDQAMAYRVGTSGAVAVNGVRSPVYGSAAVRDTLAWLTQHAGSHPMQQEYARVTSRAIGAEEQVRAALAGRTLQTPFSFVNPLARQLRMVARMIAAREALGVKRQVFLVAAGGYDLHDNLMTRHPRLLAQLSEAMASFHAATVEMGVAHQVTAFTASEFGRTLTSNGDGSDHGWGGHHLVMGGAVKGAAFYGTPPPLSVGNTLAPEDQWHVGQGRLLPSTSLQQYAATLGTWLGASPSEMGAILPNLGRFDAAGYPLDLGFMA